MFIRKRSDTLVRTVEQRYGVDLNARGDMLLGNLLERRGFASQSQLLQAYRGVLGYHARPRRLFLSFHAEDNAQVRGFRLMLRNPYLGFEVFDGSVRVPINSEGSGYIKSVIRRKIGHASVLICLIGNRTAWRDWVEWEIRTALALGKGVCGVRLKGSRGRTPLLLAQIGAPVARWNTEEIMAAIECAAARRS